ncbi:TetR family transcriptional regulator [Thiohalobacter sp. COW1]|uniref:Transcriptional regulator n=2 Tax=Thiohalobacteraceae TaxID=3085110 RepID=A0A1Z4VS59_9GAMM|nr:transcriptional regulator [Thiohalobacter thiocyanaticus]BCO30758.1 TetR family transcriptional regulator [Thiohalobacter sp. COW1]
MVRLMSTEERHRTRNPDATRRRILESAYQEVYRHGYQGTRLDDVLKATGLTKGALYHHFPNKQALGYAVVEDVIRGIISDIWRKPLEQAEDPLSSIIHTIRHMDRLAGDQITTLGCPLNNLAQEMSPLDEGFRRRIDAVYQDWRAWLARALERGRARGRIRADVDCEQVATFIVAALTGCIGIAKNAQSKEPLNHCGAGLISYLESLRA